MAAELLKDLGDITKIDPKLDWIEELMKMGWCLPKELMVRLKGHTEGETECVGCYNMCGRLQQEMITRNSPSCLGDR